MPVNANRDLFSGQLVDKNDLSLRLPQVRVLHVLMPKDLTAPVIEWVIVNRAQLSVRTGCTSISGTITRALNGIKEGSSSGRPCPGLLARKMIEEIVLDIEGVLEVNYRITPLGAKAYHEYINNHGPLKELREAARCINTHQGKGDTHRSKRRKLST